MKKAMLCGILIAYLASIFVSILNFTNGGVFSDSIISIIILSIIFSLIGSFINCMFKD